MSYAKVIGIRIGIHKIGGTLKEMAPCGILALAHLLRVPMNALATCVYGRNQGSVPIVKQRKERHANAAESVLKSGN